MYIADGGSGDGSSAASPLGSIDDAVSEMNDDDATYILNIIGQLPGAQAPVFIYGDIHRRYPGHYRSTPYNMDSQKHTRSHPSAERGHAEHRGGQPRVHAAGL